MTDIAAVSDAEVLSVEGTPTKLGSLYAEHPVVFVFLRHFG